MGSLAPRVRALRQARGELSPLARRLPVACAGAAIVASFFYLVANGTHFGFVYDDWVLLVRRPGWSPGALLDPFHENLIAGPAVVYKTLQATFGMTSAVPYYVVAIAVFAIAGGLLFAFLRVRVGDWLALAGVLPMLFLGASSEDLLWAFQIGYFGSVAAGLGMLLALERESRGADAVAAGLLVLSLAFGSVGIPFTVGALLAVATGPRPRRRRWFVPGAGIVAYAVWALGWGRQAQHHLSVHNLVHLPSYLYDAAGAGLAAICGQQVNSVADPGHPPVLFRILALLLVAALITKIVRDRRISPGLAVALAMVLTFWIIAGLDRSGSRPPISNRFQYPGAIFILLVAGEALRGVRLPRLASIVAVAAAVAATVAGMKLLEEERLAWNNVATQTRAMISGVEAAGPAAPAGAHLEHHNVQFAVGLYRDAIARFGSPAFDEREVLEDAETVGPEVDRALVEVTGLRLVPIAEAAVPSPTSDCQVISAAGGPDEAVVPAGRLTLTARGARPAQIAVARFALQAEAPLGTIRPGASASLDLPQGGWGGPWRLSPGEGTVEVCR